MYLSARVLLNVVDVNTWEFGDVYRLSQGDTPSFYFQLVDMDKDRDSLKTRPSGKRYMPAAGATLAATVQNVNGANTLSKVAVQPFANDPSIWRVDILSTDPLQAGTFSLKIVLTEGSKTTSATISNVISVASLIAAKI